MVLQEDLYKESLKLEFINLYKQQWLVLYQDIYWTFTEKNGGDCYSKTEQTVTVLMAQN